MPDKINAEKFLQERKSNRVTQDQMWSIKLKNVSQNKPQRDSSKRKVSGKILSQICFC